MTHQGDGLHREAGERAVLDRVQHAWDTCPSLPPIDFTTDEALHLASALRNAEVGSET